MATAKENVNVNVQRPRRRKIRIKKRSAKKRLKRPNTASIVTTSYLDCPDDAVLNVAQFLSVDDLLCLSVVDKRHYALFTANNAWKQYYRSVYKIAGPMLETDHEYFAEMHEGDEKPVYMQLAIKRSSPHFYSESSKDRVEEAIAALRGALDDPETIKDATYDLKIALKNYTAGCLMFNGNLAKEIPSKFGAKFDNLFRALWNGTYFTRIDEYRGTSDAEEMKTEWKLYDPRRGLPLKFKVYYKSTAQWGWFMSVDIKGKVIDRHGKVSKIKGALANTFQSCCLGPLDEESTEAFLFFTCGDVPRELATKVVANYVKFCLLGRYHVSETLLDYENFEAIEEYYGEDLDDVRC